MTGVDDRYLKAKAIAGAALDHPPQARRELIDARCGSDEALLREVRWLIEAAENPACDDVPEPLRTAARNAVADVSIEAPLPRNYRLLKPLGEGGMGTVYLAERIDGDLRQRVALKLLHPITDQDPALVRRFAAERRILAGLAHPNIAHLIDAGFTAEGRPFLAMEYVDGEHIDRWCDTHAPGLRARVDLFLKVCAAVDHAHRHLVIHRDIKPANILVGADAEPKLLDFGIARLLDDDAAALRTETGLRALTLAYASPEQIEGRPLNTATDVYSLGVVLYQLVAGVRPFDHLETAHLLSNAIVSGEITPPSRQKRLRARATRPLPLSGADVSANGAAADADPTAPESVAAGRLRKDPGSARMRARQRVPADLDAIVLKALRREPAQRYGSVADLVADLRRFLQSRPVLARRGRWPYRARRFAWRWRWALVVAAGFAVLLGAFMLDREAQLEKVARERDRAQALVGFMNDLFENADSLRSRGNQVTVRELLDRGARELQARHDLAPSQRSSMLFAMGRAYNALGLGQQALPLLLSAQALLADADKSPVEQAAVQGELAAAYSTSRDTAASIAADAKAIGLLRAANGDHRDEIARLRIRELHNHVDLLDIPLADSRRQLLGILTELKARARPPEALLMRAYSALAVAYSDQEGSQAVDYANHAVAIATRLYGPDDPRILASRSAQAMTVAMHGADAEHSIALYRSLIEDYRRLVGSGLGLSGIVNNLGITLSRVGRNGEAIAAYRQAADIALKAAGDTDWSYLLAISNLANLQSRGGNPDEAQTLIRGILPILAGDAASGSSTSVVTYASALDILASASMQQGRPGDAQKNYAKADRLLATIDADAYAETRAEMLQGLADSLAKLGRHAESDAALDRLKTLMSKSGHAAGGHGKSSADRRESGLPEIELQ